MHRHPKTSFARITRRANSSPTPSTEISADSGGIEFQPLRAEQDDLDDSSAAPRSPDEWRAQWLVVISVASKRHPQRHDRGHENGYCPRSRQREARMQSIRLTTRSPRKEHLRRAQGTPFAGRCNEKSRDPRPKHTNILVISLRSHGPGPHDIHASLHREHSLTDPSSQSSRIRGDRSQRLLSWCHREPPAEARTAKHDWHSRQQQDAGMRWSSNLSAVENARHRTDRIVAHRRTQSVHGHPTHVHCLEAVRRPHGSQRGPGTLPTETNTTVFSGWTWPGQAIYRLFERVNTCSVQ